MSSSPHNNGDAKPDTDGRGVVSEEENKRPSVLNQTDQNTSPEILKMSNPPAGNRAKRPLRRTRPADETSLENGGNVNEAYIGNGNGSHESAELSDYYKQSPTDEQDTVPEMTGPSTASRRAKNNSAKRPASRERSVSFSHDVDEVGSPDRPDSPTSTIDENSPSSESTAKRPRSAKANLLRRLSSIPYAGKHSTMATFDCLERPLSVFFYRYGRMVSSYPYPFIIFPLLFTAAMSLGLLRLEEVTDAVYLFTPTNAASKYERQIIHDHWPLTDNNYIPGRTVTQARETQIVAMARDNGNILEKQYAEAINRLDMFIQNRVKVEFNNRTWGYHDLCLQWQSQGCPGNKHVQLISQLWEHGINITFPSVRVGFKHAYLGGAMGGVSLAHGEDGKDIIASAQAWIMVYHLKFFPENASYVSGLWEHELQKQMMEYPPDPYIWFTFFHSQSLADELQKNAAALAPRFVFSFVILATFAIICGTAMIKGSVNAVLD
uniref:Uncharacterized protein n=1 Tax=Plectus sambesii TaxID=2011161 RepID=A0A914WK07_9BILA